MDRLVVAAQTFCRDVESSGMRCSDPLKSVTECNLVEEDERKVRTKRNGFTFTIKPYEIKTFRILTK